MFRLLGCVFSDAFKNEQKKFSHTKIGLMIALTVFLSKIAVMPNQMFINHITEITLSVIALTGSRHILNSFSERIKK